MKDQDDARRAPLGWVATAIGGTVGGAACGAFALFTAFAYFDNQPDSGLEAIGWAFLWATVGTLVGAAGGSALLLRMRDYDRAVASGILFSVSVTVLLIGWAFVGGQVIDAWDEGVILFIALGTTIPLAAWGTRAVLTR